jgi:hypothetical protein
MTFETVFAETPAEAATSFSVGNGLALGLILALSRQLIITAL